MNTNLLNEMAEASMKGTIHFGQIVGKLMEAGVESYRVDFVRKEKTYYMPNGESHVVSIDFKKHDLAQKFDGAGIQAAIKASQRGEIKFIEFIPRALDAGVRDYTVYIQGKKVIYFGRKGESHTELFPQAK